MPNYVSVLAKYEKQLQRALAAAGIGTGAFIGPDAYRKIKAALDAENVSHQTHDAKTDVGPGRVHNV